MEYYSKSFSISVKVFDGEDHPNVASVHSNMAFIYDEQKKHDLAIKHYEKSLRINQKLLGEDHPNVGTVFNNLGRVYLEKGMLDFALHVYKASLAIKQKALGPVHPHVA